MAENETEIVPGRRAVLEALRAGRPLRKILLASGTRHGGTLGAILAEARREHVLVQFVARTRLDALVGGMPHQGVVALTAAKATVGVEEILGAARARKEPPFLLVLDGVQNPANLGSVLRTANGTGVHGVIIPKHRAVGLTSAVAKTSAGAIEYVPVAQVTNIVRTLDALKAEGIWIVGADPSATITYASARLAPPVAVVLGGEERGLGRLVKEACDVLVRLPMRGQIASLNVAVVAGVLLYEAQRQQRASTPR